MVLLYSLMHQISQHGVQVFVANFQAPAPPTQAAFFFFGTELLNPCMWSTDSDFLQAPYFPGNGSQAAPCEGCKVWHCRVLVRTEHPAHRQRIDDHVHMTSYHSHTGRCQPQFGQMMPLRAVTRLSYSG